jgi:hypothetical protein
MLVAQPLAHHDLADLPDELAAEMGVLLVHLTRAMEALPQVGRVHLAKWGDGERTCTCSSTPGPRA